MQPVRKQGHAAQRKREIPRVLASSRHCTESSPLGRYSLPDPGEPQVRQTRHMSSVPHETHRSIGCCGWLYDAQRRLQSGVDPCSGLLFDTLIMANLGLPWNQPCSCVALSTPEGTLLIVFTYKERHFTVEETEALRMGFQAHRRFSALGASFIHALLAAEHMLLKTQPASAAATCTTFRIPT